MAFFCSTHTPKKIAEKKTNLGLHTIHRNMPFCAAHSYSAENAWQSMHKKLFDPTNRKLGRCSEKYTRDGYNLPYPLTDDLLSRHLTDDRMRCL